MLCLNCRTQPARTKYCSRTCQLAHRGQRNRALQTETHIIIPDTQTKPGIPIDHLRWIGQYIQDWGENHPEQALKIIHLGDHWDMPSLSSYDAGKKTMEGRRVHADIEAGNTAFRVLDTAISPDLPADRHFCYGNHEERIARAVNHDATLDGILGYDLLALRGWTTHPYQSTLLLGGVTYSHLFYNPLSGRPYAGNNLDLRLKTIGFSFTMGHQQGLWWTRRELANGRTLCGLVSGACYLHAESYKGPQANDHWRGIVICHNVEDGNYDPMFVSLDYLCRRFEGCRLVDYSPKEWL